MNTNTICPVIVQVNIEVNKMRTNPVLDRTCLTCSNSLSFSGESILSFPEEEREGMRVFCRSYGSHTGSCKVEVDEYIARTCTAWGEE